MVFVMQPQQIIGRIIQWVIMEKRDYFYLHKKDVTGLRTHVSNVSSIIKAFTAPLMDSLKTTKKRMLSVIQIH